MHSRSDNPEALCRCVDLVKERGRFCAVRHICIATFVLALGVRCSPSEDPPPAGDDPYKVTLVAPRTAWTWPMYMALEGGYYNEHGLDVDLIFANHPAGVAMLTSGAADMNLLPLQRALQLGSLDESFVAIGTPLGKWLFALIAHEDIAVVEDLRGRRLGIGQYGDATYTYGIALLSRFGLRLEDIRIVVVGGEGRIPALTSGQIDATMLSAPAWFRLEPYGFRSLADITEFEEIHTPNVLLLRRSTITQHPELPERLIRAHAQAVKRFYEDREFALAAHQAYDAQDEADLARVYEIYRAANMMDRVPWVDAEAVRAVIDTVPDTLVAGQLAAFDYAGLIDNSPVERLTEEGFFEELFGPGALP